MVQRVFWHDRALRGPNVWGTPIDVFLSYLPPEISPVVAAALLVMSAGTSFFTAAFGIGGGLMLLAAMGAVLPPSVLIPVHGVVQLGSNSGRLAVLFEHVAWKAAPAFVLGAVIGAGTGGSIALSLPPAMVKIGVGVFILLSIYARMPQFGRGAGVVAGLVSSFLTMFFGATGPFVAAHVRSLGLERMSHVATFACLMSVQHILKVVAFALLGFAFGPYVPLMAGMIATGFVGTLVGRWVLKRGSEGNFQLMLKIVLTLLAARMIWLGGADLLAAA